MPIFIPGSWGRKSNNKGFTLLELLITLAVVGIVVSLAAVSLREALDVQLKNSANELSGLIRYVRTKSVTENKYHRITLDFEGSSYGVEEGTEPFVISSAQTLTEPEEEEKEDGSEEKGSFAGTEDRLLQTKKLRSGVSFKDVQLSYVSQPVTQGKAFLYFFPDGYGTPAVINLKDEEDESNFSLEVLPMTGRVKIEGEYRELQR